MTITSDTLKNVNLCFQVRKYTANTEFSVHVVAVLTEKGKILCTVIGGKSNYAVLTRSPRNGIPAILMQTQKIHLQKIYFDIHVFPSQFQ